MSGILLAHAKVRGGDDICVGDGGRDFELVPFLGLYPGWHQEQLVAG